MEGGVSGNQQVLQGKSDLWAMASTDIDPFTNLLFAFIVLHGLSIESSVLRAALPQFRRTVAVFQFQAPKHDNPLQDNLHNTRNEFCQEIGFANMLPS